MGMLLFKEDSDKQLETRQAKLEDPQGVLFAKTNWHLARVQRYGFCYDIMLCCKKRGAKETTGPSSIERETDRG